MAVPFVTREKTKRVEVLLIPSVYEELKIKALSEGLPMTTIIKLAIRDYLDKDKRY